MKIPKLRLPVLFSRCKRKGELDPLSEAERVEEHLWLLALLLIFLLSVGLFLLSATGNLQGSSGSGGAVLLAPLFSVLGNDLTTSFLLVMVLLICAYFRERLIARRAENRKLVDSLRTANIALEHRTRQITNWGELSHTLIANFDLPSLLDLIVATAIELTQAEKASVMLLDDEHKFLHIAAARGLSAEVIKSTCIPNGEGIAGWVAQQGEPLLLARNHPDLRFQDKLQRDEIASAVSVPLKVEGVIVGTLNVSESTRPHELGQEELRALCLFATQAALALEKAHLNQEAQIQLEKMLKVLNELQNTQQQLIQSEKLASVGTLAGGVAHEINNPLMVILGRTDLLLMGSDLPPKVRCDLEIIREETSRISEIVRGLLTFSRRTHDNKFALTNVNEIIEKTLALTEPQLKGEGIIITRRLAADLPLIDANAGQLQQVFTNMVINAYHAMHHGGRLEVRTELSADGQITIEFEDTGCGIPKENLVRIFDPFFTTKEEGKGTGLGLAVSNTIIGQHGGALSVKSEAGKGTCFTITLPLIYKRPEPPPENLKPPTIPHEPRLVLAAKSR